MNSKHSDLNILSHIKYNDYIALFCFLDSEWSKRRPNAKISESEKFQQYLHAQKNFVKGCRGLAKNITQNHQQFMEKNTAFTDKTSIEPFLFNPICYTPFGHSDDLSIVFLDDFDPVFHITSEIETTVEDICVAFCPKFKSFEIEEKEIDKYFDIATVNKVFCDIDSLTFSKPDTFDIKFGIPLHPFLEKMPLLAFSKLKMNSLATTGQSLLFQQALYRAMTIKMIKTLHILGKKLNKGDKEFKNLIDLDDFAYINNGEVVLNHNQLRIVFLDLLGTEEIGTLIFCNNYSIAMSLISAVRSITIKDVIKYDKTNQLKSLLNKEGNSHRNIQRVIKNVNDFQNESDLSYLMNGHSFRWTHTSLAISPKNFLSPDSSPCKGKVETHSEIQIHPGHREEAISKLREITDINPNYYRCHTGITDILSYCTPLGEKEQSSLYNLSDILSQINRIRMTFWIKQEKDHGNDIADISTRFTIPIPKIEGNCNRLNDDHISILAVLLKKIQQTLCYRGKRRNSKKSMVDDAGKLDLNMLRDIVLDYTISTSLRRSIEFLYQNFAILLADPFLFDVVLDLYDTFATFHKVLTEHIPNDIKSKQGKDTEQIIYLDTGKINQLATYVDAIPKLAVPEPKGEV